MSTSQEKSGAGMNRRGFMKWAAAIGAACSTPRCGGPLIGDGEPGSEADPSRAKGIPEPAYFAQLASDLEAAGMGTPQIMIDLDRLDANASSIVRGAGRDRYRIVEKSLPSLDLLGYVRQQTGSSRFLVLHLPFLPPLVGAFPDAQVLVGKTHPTNAVNQFFQAIPVVDWPSVADRVTFLADSRSRLDELTALAANLSLTLRVGVELDVGLRRTGVRSLQEIRDVLAGFVANPTRVKFAGTLGYDGHVAFAPAASGLEETSARAAFRTVTATYQSFVDVVRNEFGGLWRDDLVFNSGGTSTYPLYQSGPVNDVAAGGGLLRPGSYPDMFISELQPAIFIAAPVLNHYDAVEIPFVRGPSTALLRDKQAIGICGGGWPASYVWPPGLENVPIVTGSPNQSLIPNQSSLMAPRIPAIVPGDWIFQYPLESDALFQFENILLIRNGRLESTPWRAYPRRY